MEGEREREQKRVRERERESLIHFPQMAIKASSGWGWSRELAASSGSPAWVAGTQVLESPSAAFPRQLSGSWAGSGAARTHTGAPLRYQIHFLFNLLLCSILVHLEGGRKHSIVLKSMLISLLDRTDWRNCRGNLEGQVELSAEC